MRRLIPGQPFGVQIELLLVDVGRGPLGFADPIALTHLMARLGLIAVI